MAGIEIKGFEELKRNVAHLRNDILDRALRAAQDAAAAVFAKAVEAAAPRKSGALAGSVITRESIDRKQLSGSNRQRLLVGPGKKKGYYGFFQDKGWNTKKGKHIDAPHPAWFENAAKSVESDAYEAGVKAFQHVIEMELK